MYRYKRLLVGMNLTDRDQGRCRYAGMIARLAGSEETRFLHVAEHLDIPEAIDGQYPEIRRSALETARDILKSTVRDHFQGSVGVRTSSEVMEGEPLDGLLEIIRSHDVDLVIVGRKAGEQEPGVLAGKLARKAPCSVLFLPEDRPASISRILVALDFSGHSRNALEEAVAIAASAGLGEILCVHVYRVPIGYDATGKTYEEFSEIMRRNAEKDFSVLTAKIDARGIKLSTRFELDGSPSKTILAVAVEEGIDLLIVGARGRSAGAAILLGSVTERLIHSTTFPLMAVKKKGAGMGMLEALLKL